MIINISGIWEAAAYRHVGYVNNRIDAYFISFFAAGPKNAPPHEIKAARFLQENRHVITSKTRSDFSNLISKFNAIFKPGTADFKLAIELFKSIFDYNQFAEKDALGWNAYKLCKSMQWKVCPYCHIHSTETALPNPVTKGYRPQIDHVYSQSKYPFLSLTLGNLIPCCAQCNGPGFKHVKDFYTHPHLNPLIDTENINFRLAVTEKCHESDPVIKAFRGDATQYRIHVTPTNTCAKTSRSLNTFQLVDRYQEHVVNALRICRNTKERIDFYTSTMQTIEQLPDQTSREVMRRQMFGFLSGNNSIVSFDIAEANSYKAHLTGKMQKDIFIEANAGNSIKYIEC